MNAHSGPAFLPHASNGFWDAFRVHGVNQRGRLPTKGQSEDAKQKPVGTSEQHPAPDGKHQRDDIQYAWFPSEIPQQPVHQTHARLQPKPITSSSHSAHTNFPDSPS